MIITEVPSLEPIIHKELQSSRIKFSEINYVLLVLKLSRTYLNKIWLRWVNEPTGIRTQASLFLGPTALSARSRRRLLAAVLWWGEYCVVFKRLINYNWIKTSHYLQDPRSQNITPPILKAIFASQGSSSLLSSPFDRFSGKIELQLLDIGAISLSFRRCFQTIFIFNGSILVIECKTFLDSFTHYTY